VIPYRLVHLHPHKPPEQQVVLQLLHQHALTAHRIEDLQQQRSQQSFRCNRRTPHVEVQLSGIAAKNAEDFSLLSAEFFAAYRNRDYERQNRLTLQMAGYLDPAPVNPIGEIFWGTGGAFSLRV
jgi:hypothetical protein